MPDKFFWMHSSVRFSRDSSSEGMPTPVRKRISPPWSHWDTLGVVPT